MKYAESDVYIHLLSLQVHVYSVRQPVYTIILSGQRVIIDLATRSPPQSPI